MKKNKDKLAHNFSLALFASEKDLEQKKNYADQLNAISSLFMGSRDFVLFLTSPTIAITEKAALFESAHISPKVVSFLEIIIEQNDQSLLTQIARDFSHQTQRVTKTASGTVWAHKKTDIQKDVLSQLQENLSRVLNKKVSLTVVEDKEIIGGFKAEVGDLSLDATFKSALNTLNNTGSL